MFVWDQYIIGLDVAGYHMDFLPAFTATLLLLLGESIMKCKTVSYYHLLPSCMNNSRMYGLPLEQPHNQTACPLSGRVAVRAGGGHESGALSGGFNSKKESVNSHWWSTGHDTLYLRGCVYAAYSYCSYSWHNFQALHFEVVLPPQEKHSRRAQLQNAKFINTG